LVLVVATPLNLLAHSLAAFELLEFDVDNGSLLSVSLKKSN
jgi:hypothetical protein